VRDVERSWDGYVAFSVFVPNDRKLAGSDTQRLLDDLAGTYCQNYVVDGNLGICRENWTLFAGIVEEYDKLLVPADSEEDYRQGSAKAAFAYYSSPDELQRYFNVPYQQEYKDFKQILLIENGLPGLLGLLQHDPKADLTGEIKLDNPRYKLKDFRSNGKNGIDIKLWANGKELSNGDVIKHKDTIRIIYSKDCYASIDETGKITDSNIAQYLFVADENKITVKNDVALQPEIGQISLKLKDIEDNSVSDAEIICKHNFSAATKTVADNTLCFEGEELKGSWKVFAKKDALKSKPVDFVPNDYIENKSEPADLTLALQEYKKVTFHVIGEERKLGFSVQNESGESYGKFIEFYGDDIHKSWILTIRPEHPKYEDETFSYCPAKDENPKSVELRRRLHTVGGNNNGKEEKKYYLKIDETKAYRTWQGQPIKDEYTYGDPNFGCDPHSGYEFCGWEFHPKQLHGYDGYHEAVVKKLRGRRKIGKILFIVGLVIPVLIVAIVLIAKPDSGKKQRLIDEQQFLQVSLRIDMILREHGKNLDSLQLYKDSWNKQKPKIKEKSTFLSLLGIGKPALDSAEYIKWEKTEMKIEKVIIEAEKERRNLEEKAAEEQKKKEEEEEQKKKEEQQRRKEAERKRKEEEEAEKRKNQTTEESWIRTDQGQEAGTSAYGQTGMPSGGFSPDTLEKEFWNLVNTRLKLPQMQDYKDLLQKYKGKNKNHDIIKYLDKICANSKAFDKFLNIPKQTRRNAKTLSAIDIQ
jgi:hypothetical protein